MTGIIDVGGGMRDIYGSGVLDYCLDNKINFDYIIANRVKFFNAIKIRQINSIKVFLDT